MYESLSSNLQSYAVSWDEINHILACVAIDSSLFLHETTQSVSYSRLIRRSLNDLTQQIGHINYRQMHCPDPFVLSTHKTYAFSTFTLLTCILHLVYIHVSTIEHFFLWDASVLQCFSYKQVHTQINYIVKTI